MNISGFEYFSPRSVEEASQLLLEKGKGAFVMAGGTDLLIKIRRKLLKPAVIIGLKGIPGLDKISFNRKQGLTIGATALLSDVAHHPKILRHFPAIAYAAKSTANTQIRNMGTVAGNLCNAAPSADNAPTLLAMGAEVILAGTQGERRLPLDQFFIGPGQTAIEPGEILTAIFVPTPPPHSGVSYQWISARGKVDISAVGVGVMVTMKGKVCSSAKIALGAVAPTPMRARKAEKILSGKVLSSRMIEKAALEASREAKPISDVRASAEYRKQMVAVLTGRALSEARQRAAKG